MIKNNPGFKFEYFSKTIRYNDFNIETYAIGSGDKVVLSFPSFPHSGIYYLWFMNHYDLNKVRFITLDLPGWIGYSDNIFKNRKFDIEDYINIIKKIIEEYNLEKFSVLGYSFGAALTIRLVHEFPMRIEKIALVSPIIDSRPIQKTKEVIGINLIKKFNLESAFKYYLWSRWNYYRPRVLAEGFPQTLLSLYDGMVRNADPRILLESIYTLFHLDWSKYLGDLEGKKLMIVNSHKETKLFRHQAEILRRKFSYGKSAFYPGGHGDFILHPQSEVVKEVVKFLTHD